MIEENIFHKGEFWVGITAWSIFSSAVHLSCPSVPSLHLAVDLSVLAVHSTQAGVQGVQTDPGLQSLHPVQLPSAARRSWITSTLPPLLQLSSEKSSIGLEREISTRLGTKMMKMKTPLSRFRMFAIVAKTRANLWFYQSIFNLYNLLLIGHRFKWKCEENCVTWSSQDSLRLFQRAQGSKWDQRL